MGAARLVRRSAFTLLGLIAALLVLASMALVLLMTPPGERWAKELALSKINQQWRGHVSIGEVDFALDQLELREIRVQDPEGTDVLRAERLFVEVHLWNLLRRVIRIERLEIAGYQLYLRQGPDGDWNLARAVERVEPPPIEEDVGEALPVIVEELVLTSGLIEARMAQRDQHLRVEALRWDGVMSYQDELLQGNLAIVGRVVQPRAEPLRLTAAADVHEGRQRASLELSVGPVNVAGSMTLPERPGRDARWLREIDAALKVIWPQFEAAGHRYGPLELHARLKAGELTVSRLSLELPGMSVSQRPVPDGTAVRVQVNALGQTAKSLAALSGAALPEITGSGQLDIRLTPRQGRSEELMVDGSFEQLRLDALQVSGVRLAGSVADVGRPADGSLEITIDELHLLDAEAGDAEAGDAEAGDAEAGDAEAGDAEAGDAEAGMRFEGLSLRFEQGQQELELALGLAAPYALGVDVAGHFDAEGQRLAVQRLEVRYPDNHWTLHSPPALLSWGSEQWGLRELDLVAAGQRIELYADYGPRTQRAELVVRGLRLESIPKEWLPPEARASGVLDLRVHAQGPLEAPHVRFDLGASELQWQGVGGLKFELAGDYRDERLDARASGSGLGASIEARVDLPVRYPPQPGEALELQASATGLELARMWPALAHLVPADVAESIEQVAGKMQLRAEVSGQWPEPSVRAQARLERGTLKWQGVESYREVALSLEVSPEQVQLQELSAVVQGGGLHVKGEATGTGEIWDYDYELDVDAKRFPVPLQDPLLATAKLRLVGLASLERVTSRITIDGLELRRRQPEEERDLPQARRVGSELPVERVEVRGR